MLCIIKSAGELGSRCGIIILSVFASFFSPVSKYILSSNLKEKARPIENISK